jgi:superfamily II DNA or RNA helicase
MMSWLAERLAANGKRTSILNHRSELADQIDDTLSEFGCKHDLIQAGSKYYNPRMAVHVASVFTLVRRLSKVQVPDYVFPDEAHHAISGSTWGKIIEYWRLHNPNLITIGWTATPQRLSGEGLGQMFDDMIIGPDVAELIRLGRLSPYKMFAPPVQVDTAGLHHRGGDFVKAEVDLLMDKPKITGNAISHYKKYLNGAPTLVFCNSIAHAHHVAEEFGAAGYRAAAMDGKMNRRDRARFNKDFANGQLNILTSCDLISEGYDVPGAMGCINLRPTESLALCLQQWGRVLRFVEGKTAVILDHVGNSARHGLPDSPREWSLEGTAGEKKKRDPDDIAIRQCGKCGCINPPTAKECRDCGTVFPIKARTVEEVEGELEEVDPKAEYWNKRHAQADAKDYDALVALGRMRGYEKPEKWAQHLMDARRAKLHRKRREKRWAQNN